MESSEYLQGSAFDCVYTKTYLYLEAFASPQQQCHQLSLEFPAHQARKSLLLSVFTLPENYLPKVYSALLLAWTNLVLSIFVSVLLGGIAVGIWSKAVLHYVEQFALQTFSTLCTKCQWSFLATKTSPPCKNPLPLCVSQCLGVEMGGGRGEMEHRSQLISVTHSVWTQYLNSLYHDNSFAWFSSLSESELCIP